ncbi:MAG: amino acid permease [Acidobacteriota bacterium]
MSKTKVSTTIVSPNSVSTAKVSLTKVSLTTATSITVANMVGTGVFTSLGFQVVDVHSGFALLLLWAAGGVFALCGALAYGELAAALPRSGGEFHFLSAIFHPALGFLAGWVSLTVGFAAPIALAAMAFGQYLARVVPGLTPLVASCVVVALVTLAHLRDLKFSSSFQNAFTLLKVGLVLVFIVAGVLTEQPTAIDFAPQPGDLEVVLGSSFAISLLFVMFAYSGWNAATYITGEVADPATNVPRSLVIGTALVTLLYVGLNWAFLRITPIADLAGQVEVGHIVAEDVFGQVGGRWMSTILCIALISTISAMTWAGPRVTQTMGQDFAFFRAFAATHRDGSPRQAILLQTAIVLLLLLTATFEVVLVYIQFTLVLSSFLAVLGVFELRRKAPDLPRPYRTWGYPVTPLLFLALSVATMGHTLVTRPWESLAGLATVAVGLPIYWLSPRMGADESSPKIKPATSADVNGADET